EDGIRDFHVTGVQTCALPISQVSRSYKRDGCAAAVARAPQSLSLGARRGRRERQAEREREREREGIRARGFTAGSPLCTQPAPQDRKSGVEGTCVYSGSREGS